MEYISPSLNVLGLGNPNDHDIRITGTIDSFLLGDGGASPGPAGPMMMAASAGPAAGPAFPWWIVVVAIGAVVLLSD